VAARGPLDDSCLYGEFPIVRQRRLARDLLAALPLPEAGWRLDDTVHPFAEGISPRDIRLTTRYDPAYLGTSVWSVIHEAGHGLYEAGMPQALARTPAGRPRSLGLHESQSRLWENWVGRGRPFLRALLPLLREHFPERFAAIDPNGLYRAANVVRRSLIRVEADELTYNLHIAIRFELELELFEDRIAIADLPEAWNARYADYLGLEVPDDAAGVLQDVHWAGGSFGYFPTYSLGNVIAAQLWRRAHDEIRDLDEQLAAGELAALYGWLGRTLFPHAGKHSAAATVERALGESIDPEPLLAHLSTKFGELYGLAT
jgi:carboxypeptidase Taq